MRHIYLFLLAICICLCSCENVNYKSSVPNVGVQYYVYITSEHPEFIVDNGYQTMTVTKRRFDSDYIGYAGLLIWVGMDAQYHAADLCCPKCVVKTAPVQVDGLFAECPLCGERYDLSYGLANPTKGLTRETLKRYTTILRNSASGLILQVHN